MNAFPFEVIEGGAKPTSPQRLKDPDHIGACRRHIVTRCHAEAGGDAHALRGAKAFPRTPSRPLLTHNRTLERPLPLESRERPPDSMKTSSY
jgi:hypothetical protein